MNQIEVLAPAGSFETMKAAYKAGADAVYMGGDKFGARAYADNAVTEEMLEAIDYAHLHHRRLYMTVNTLLKNIEIEKQLKAYLKPFYEQGLDAVIVQDLGVMELIHSYFPDMDIHASTQMTVCGPEYGQWLGKRGATRIVTPRELTYEEISAMKKATGLEIETFVHGALCYCYSGQCLMSSMIGGRSGNRGRCAQPCRLPWSFEGDNGNKSGYLLSPKDLCSLESIPDLLTAGVDSLKIEGRMKKPEYAALTTAMYRKYVDMYLERGREGFAVKKSDLEELMDLYNRGGFTDGYFKRHNGPVMMSTARPNHSGLQVGTAKTLKNGTLLIHADRELHKGDVLELPGQVSVKIDADIRVGSDFKQKYTGKPLKKAVTVMRTRNEALIQRVTENFVKNYSLKEKVYGSVSISKDLPATIDLYYEDYHVRKEGSIVQAASNRPLAEEDIRKRLMKTGATAFDFEQLEIALGEGCYMTVQDLNQLRREALDELQKQILDSYHRTLDEDGDSENQAVSLFGDEVASDHKAREIHVLVSDIEQLKAVLQFAEIRRIYMNDEGDDALIRTAAEMVHAAGREFYLALPHIFRNDTAAQYRNRKTILEGNVSDGFLVRNMEQVLMLQSMGLEQPRIADYNMYTMNDHAASVYKGMVDALTIPLELNRREISRLRFRTASELIAYGYTPLMFSAQCLVKTTGKCTHTPGIYMLEDRLHKHFRVKNVCAFCYNIIYNSVPLHLLDAVRDDREVSDVASVRLQFLDEKAADVSRIVAAYIQAVNGEKTQGKSTISDYTKGHYQRGIE